jgi:hypothetical protein
MEWDAGDEEGDGDGGGGRSLYLLKLDEDAMVERRGT